MKVLLVSPYSKKEVGGIGTWTKLMLDYCHSRNDIVFLFQNTATHLPKRWSLRNQFTHWFVGIADSIRILIVLIYNLIIKKPDIVHYTSSAATALYKDRIAVYITKKIFCKKFIIHWRFGRIPQIFKEKGLEYCLFMKVIKDVDLSIVLDEISYNILNNEGVNCIQIPNPIPLSLQKCVEKLDLKVIGNNRKSGEILFVGHMLKTKGAQEILMACVDNYAVKKLIMVGPFFDDNFKNELVIIANKRESGKWVEFVGEKNREEVWQYYKSCSVFCLPSYSEGFPNVILEAMSFACPIIATNVGAIPEMLNNGCGICINPKNAEALSEALTKMLLNRDIANEMGNNAYKKVLDKYTIDSVYKQYYKIWSDTINSQ